MQEFRESVENKRETPKRIFTIEHKKNLSESMKGRIPWNKGLTKEDPRVAKNTDNTQRNPNLRENLSRALMGHRSTFLRKHTQEEKDKISLAHRGKKKEYNVWNKGKTKYTNSKLADIGKSISIALMNKPEEWRRETSRRAKMNLKMPKVSKLEIEVIRQLREHGFIIIPQYPIRVSGIITHVDIYLESKVCIYLDGVYWHNKPGIQERDAKINKALLENNYRVLRFWDNGKIDPSSIVKKILDEDMFRPIQ